ncbi:hypothetical protein D9M70_614920 [compost metagenome]
MNLIRQRADNSRPFEVYVNNVQQAAITPGSGGTGVVRMANGWMASSFQCSLNGALGSEVKAGNVPTVTQLSLGKASVVAATFTGYLRRIIYLPKRLTNQQLQGFSR